MPLKITISNHTHNQLKFISQVMRYDIKTTIETIVNDSYERTHRLINEFNRQMTKRMKEQKNYQKEGVYNEGTEGL